MHSVTDEKQGTSTASAVVVETGAKQETAKPKAARQPAKSAKQSKPAKPGKQAKQAKPANPTAAAKPGGKTSERSNKKAEVIALMKRAKGATLKDDRGLDPIDYAPHGGSFPIVVGGAGFIGSITVSGLPQREDHNVVVAALCEFLGKDLQALALAPRP